MQLSDATVEVVVERAEQARQLYHRLVLVVGADDVAGPGQACSLRDVAERLDAPVVKVGLELASRLLDLTDRQRPIHAPRLLEEVVAETAADIVLVDRIEILFDAALHQQPLRLLQRLSRNRTVVAAWPGSVEDGHLVHALPGHPEYGRYPADDVEVVGAEAAA